MLALLAITAALAGSPEQPDLVLITLDTTRADALSCYGKPAEIRRELPPVTPVIDELARDGARFTRFYANAPTTLSSHATLLTGLDPHQHAIPRNGYPLAEGVPTLATRLAEQGYQPVAAVGSAVLEAAMGLDRGFAVYDDDLPGVDGRDEDRAEGVVRRALSAVDARPDAEAPLFLWAHLWDPHGPFEAPEPWTERFVDPAYEGPLRGQWSRAEYMKLRRRGELTPQDKDYGASVYLGEVAYADHAVGLLLDGLRSRGHLNHAVVVVTADHGEVLTELPVFAWTHGFEVSAGSTHIPLVIRGFGVPLAHRAVVQRQLGASHLAPTLERALGLQPTLGQGVDAWDLLRPGPARLQDGWPERPTLPVPMEATRPHKRQARDRWNNLNLRRALLHGGWWAEAFPRHDQPLGLVGSLQPGDQGVLSALQRWMAAWDEQAPPFRHVEMTDETREALELLGYLEPEDP